MSFFRLSFVLLGFAALAACTSPAPTTAPRQGTPGGAEAGGTQTSGAFYATDVKPILDAKCVSCHVDMKTYAGAKAKGVDSASRVAAGTMPTAGLATADRSVFAAWAKAGFPEKAPLKDTSAPIDTPDDIVSYTGWTKSFLATSCMSCHAAGKDKPDLSTYAKAKTNADDILSSLQDGSMPQGGTKIAAAKIAKFQAWIDGNLLENDPPASTATDTSVDTGTDPTDDGSDPSATPVTYDGQIKALISSRCLSCHATGKTAPDMSTKAKAIANADAMVSDVTGGTMPTNGALVSSESKLFKAWLDGGSK